MNRVFAANSSGVVIDNEALNGIRTIDYKVEREQGDVHALGSNERIAVYYGASRAQGVIRVASASPKLDGLTTSGAAFQVVANLKHGQATRTVTFDECHVVGKDFAMSAGSHGETVYSFTATRVREEDKSEGGSGNGGG